MYLLLLLVELSKWLGIILIIAISFTWTPCIIISKFWPYFFPVSETCFAKKKKARKNWSEDRIQFSRNLHRVHTVVHIVGWWSDGRDGWKPRPSYSLLLLLLLRPTQLLVPCLAPCLSRPLFPNFRLLLLLLLR